MTECILIPQTLYIYKIIIVTNYTKKEAETSMNRKLKIGISLLVAMAFLLPTAAMANPAPKTYQGNEPVLGEQWGSNAEDVRPEEVRTAQDEITVAGVWQDGQLVPQSPGETTGQLYFSECGADSPEFSIAGGDIIPNAGCYQPWIKIGTDGNGPYTVEPELEIYDWNSGIENVIYETSFEDNARNYMEWQQIDGDCGFAPGTYYDGWAWSDARATDGDHSFKSTMYDEYKNMQEDWLTMKCSQALDVSDQFSVKVTFDTFVAGEYAQWYVDTWGSAVYSPLDYLDFGFLDCGSGLMYYISSADSANMKFVNSSGYFFPGTFTFFDTSIPLYNTEGVNTYGYPNPMDYTGFVEKIDDAPGWWQVTAEFPVASMPTTMAENFGLWFKWTSDKERVFEGAYVDNIEIASIESEGEKIYQGHSQSWLNVEGDTWFEFPLEWNDVAPGEYKAILKLKNDDYPDGDGYDIQQEIIFEVGDQVDCEITDLELTDDFSGEVISDGDTIEYTTDVHTTYTYHNNGNLPESDVAVKATAYKAKEETLAEYDMESGFSYYYFTGNAGQIYLSNDFAWSGSSSMAFNDPNTLHYGGYDIIGMLFGDPLNMEGVSEAYWDHYFMGKLGTGDEFLTMFSAEGGRYAYYGDTLIGGDEKVDWTGPMQPQCSYEQIDMMPYWETLVSLGETLDANGNPTYGLLFGYMLVNNGDESFYYEDEFDWSGVYVDDVSINAKVRGDVAWTDTQVIPGPCEPCATCTQQFVWEDVPYSCYEIVVETLCEDDVDSSNNAMSQEFCVLENLEKMGKASGVDYTECTPEAWCVSDVVGNDCGNDGAGDHYALATNCDTHAIPAGVNDYIGLGPVHECDGIDIGHLTINNGDDDDTTFFDFESGNQGWTVVDGDGNEANWELGSTVTPAGVAGGATGQWFFIDDDAAGSGAGPSTDNWLISPDLPGVSEVDFNGDFQDMAGDGTLTVKASTDGGSTWTDAAVYTSDIGGFDLQPAVTLPSGTNKVAFHYSDNGGWAWGAHIDNVQFGTAATLSGGRDVVFESGFESWTGTLPDGWDSNTGWLDSLYGVPHSGTKHAYSWTMGDTLTKTVDLRANPELTFWKAAEGNTNPMDFELYVNGNLEYSDIGYTNTDYEEITVDLSAYEDSTGVELEFVGQTSDFYGQMLDDVLITDEEVQEGPEGDQIWFNATYQSDVNADYATVILEVAGAKTGECADFTLIGTDAFGDGWDSDYDYINDAFIDVKVNGVEVLSDFTVLSTDNTETFSACDGDTIEICYDSVQGIYESEHAWQLVDAGGNVIAEDGPGPALGCTEIPAEIGGGVCAGCEPIDCVCPEGITAWTTAAEFDSQAPGVCQEISVDLAQFLDDGDDTMCIRLRLDSTAAAGMPYAGPGIGFHLHDYTISDILYDEVTGVASDFAEDWEDGVLDHEPGCVTYGEYWEQNETNGHQFTQTWPAEPVDNALIWDTEIADAYAAWFTGDWEYNIGTGAELTLELSADGGDNWFIIAREEGPASTSRMTIPCTESGFDLTPWAGSNILIRVHVKDPAGAGGYVTVSDFEISGKQDRVPPTASISLSGNSVGPGQYAGPVTVTITATDDNAVGEVHYILDGEETVISGSSATFTVSSDGEHTVEYWAVDSTGNEGAHGTTTFSIDNTPPTVEITAPEPGLYLFGNKLLDMSKPFIIGAFTAEAVADDSQGVAVVQFLLNGEIVGEDTEAPFDTYVAVKNMGAAELGVTAIDGVGNSAEDSMDLTYYKFL